MMPVSGYSTRHVAVNEYAGAAPTAPR
jgi:hypothetical protein